MRLVTIPRLRNGYKTSWCGGFVGVPEHYVIWRSPPATNLRNLYVSFLLRPGTRLIIPLIWFQRFYPLVKLETNRRGAPTKDLVGGNVCAQWLHYQNFANLTVTPTPSSRKWIYVCQKWITHYIFCDLPHTVLAAVFWWPPLKTRVATTEPLSVSFNGVVTCFCLPPAGSFCCCQPCLSSTLVFHVSLVSPSLPLCVWHAHKHTHCLSIFLSSVALFFWKWLSPRSALSESQCLRAAPSARDPSFSKP